MQRAMMIRRARDIVFFALAFGFLIFMTLFVHAGADSAGADSAGADSAGTDSVAPVSGELQALR
jgi:hypothetical protein